MAKKRRLVTAKTWKEAPTEGRGDLGIIKSVSSSPEVLAPDALAKLFETNGKAAPQDRDRVLLWTISTEAKDRERDSIMQRGWKLRNYKNNPVVMWGHNYNLPPIGRSLDVFVDDGGKNGSLRLRAAKQFTEAQDNDFGHMIYRLASKDYLRAASVGFYPIKAKEALDEEGKAMGGFIFEKSELLESSVVPIPANPEALQGAKSVHGIDLSPYVPWAEKILDDRDAFETSQKAIKSIEQIRVIANESRSIFIIDAEEDMGRVKTDEEIAEQKAAEEEAENKSAEENCAEEKDFDEEDGGEAEEYGEAVLTYSVGGVHVEIDEDADPNAIKGALSVLTNLAGGETESKDPDPSAPSETKETAETKETDEPENKGADSDDGGIDITLEDLEGIISGVLGADEAQT